MGMLDIFRRSSADAAVESTDAAVESADSGDHPIPELSYGYAGGLINMMTGAGTDIDKAKNFYYTKRVWTRQELDDIIDSSWAMGKALEIPVDDAFDRWRTWDEEADTKLLKEYEKKYKVRELMRKIMLNGRKYGTGLGIMMLGDDETSQPIDLTKLQEGDLKSVIVVDRFDAEVVEIEEDLWSEDIPYGHPTLYRIQFPGTQTRPLEVHASRVLRFDGIERTTQRQTGTDFHWGIPNAQRIIDAVIAEDSTAAAAAHLVQEASVKIMKSADQAAYAAAGKSQNFLEKIQQINLIKSIYRIFVIPFNAVYERQTYTFAGLKDLMDRQVVRVAAAADIPVTRFSGRSPGGFDSTGESDASNYARKVAAEQIKIKAMLDQFDAVAGASFGIQVPSYTFPSILRQTEEEIAKEEKAKADALGVAVDKGAITETEMREKLSGGPVFGLLKGEAPGKPEPAPRPGQPPSNNSNGE